jgi:PAS domain S-box-containing protein
MHDVVPSGTPLDGNLAQGPDVLALVFENAPDAELLVDRHGLIIKANKQAENVFGYERRELIGKPVEIPTGSSKVGSPIDA